MYLPVEHDVIPLDRVDAFQQGKIDSICDRIAETEDLINASKSIGNNARLSVLPNRGHDILDVYENQELYSWFLQYRLHDALTGTGTK